MKFSPGYFLLLALAGFAFPRESFAQTSRDTPTPSPTRAPFSVDLPVVPPPDSRDVPRARPDAAGSNRQRNTLNPDYSHPATGGAAPDAVPGSDRAARANTNSSADLLRIIERQKKMIELLNQKVQELEEALAAERGPGGNQ